MDFSPSLLWFLAGVAFLIAEFLAPGFILLFFTIGCWIVGVTVWLSDINVTTQILIFIISSLVLLLALRNYFIKTFKGATRDNVDDRYADSKIGKTGTVTKAISPNIAGEIKVMGSFWKAVSDIDIKEGQSVVVESHESEDGLTLIVKPL